jgi:hypothetical protein
MRIRWTVGPIVLFDITVFDVERQEDKPDVVVVHHYQDDEDEEKKNDPGDMFGGN